MKALPARRPWEENASQWRGGGAVPWCICCGSDEGCSPDAATETGVARARSALVPGGSVLVEMEADEARRNPQRS
ncbi:uncharacterized protein M6B38_176100 [Iris pallida]|uniref:Uncharacterized protein n=1 Tax=Iris pallida TaxID=29817 RepID=A0AAX6E3Z6_IRIPA|nr:Uncharacterized protein M6B38_211130 [Iris pallida]KAJ6806229.1 uncharacterized protein M6B38_176100 [Iris pallida]